MADLPAIRTDSHAAGGRDVTDRALPRWTGVGAREVSTLDVDKVRAMSALASN